MAESKKIDLVVGREERGLRIDQFIAQHSDFLSKTRVRRILDNGALAINGRRERFANRTLQPGDKVTYYLDGDILKSRKVVDFGNPEVFILREDGDLVIVNKPAGMPSQPTKDPKLLDASRFFGRGKTLWPCHRLDKETSGVLVLAKSSKVAERVMDLFRSRDVKKEYLAIATGSPDQKAWTERCYLSDIIDKTGKVEIVRAGGKASDTHFELLGSAKSLNLIKCFPHTGRTHQIRVHLEKARLPILGDKLYGVGLSNIPPGFESYAVKRHFLHASSIAFVWNEELMEVTAKPTLEFKAVLDKAGLSKHLT
jgi:RluA family pseudouridine synthase